MINILNTDTHLIYPDEISNYRIEELKSLNICDEIASIDLEMVKMKLQDPDEGLGWSKDKCDAIEIQYKRFLHLCKKYGKGVVPTKDIDLFWHYHILDTRSYCEFSDDVFGGYLHHYPYFGMRGAEDEENLKKAFLNTKDLYLKEFSEEMIQENMNDCWHDCEGRCWHACASINSQ